MTGGKNLAMKYSKRVDERFHRESQALLALNGDYEFTGAKTVNVYSLPVVAMNDYQRGGASRYGSPSDLTRNVQTLTVGRDRAFTFIIDKGDKLQSQMVSDAGRALARQIREVVVPEFDSYVFAKLAGEATSRGNYATGELDKSNAYEALLHAQEVLGNHNVPDSGRVCFCSYRFANLLKQDGAFMRYSQLSQEMLVKGVMGEVDGTKIVKVPSSRLPAGAAFILTHPCAATAPKQLEEYKTHDNPPGISGWLVEGRFIYDCFVLDEKADAVFYHGAQPVLKMLNVLCSEGESGQSVVLVNSLPEGSGRYYALAESAGELPAVIHGTAITTSAWTELSGSTVTVTPGAGKTVLRVVEVDENNKPLAVGDVTLRVG